MFFLKSRKQSQSWNVSHKCALWNLWYEAGARPADDQRETSALDFSTRLGRTRWYSLWGPGPPAHHSVGRPSFGEAVRQERGKYNITSKDNKSIPLKLWREQACARVGVRKGIAKVSCRVSKGRASNSLLVLQLKSEYRSIQAPADQCRGSYAIQTSYQLEAEYQRLELRRLIGNSSRISKWFQTKQYKRL